jgi:ParB family transcriptional regulator, chromosome partitioning protein
MPLQLDDLAALDAPIQEATGQPLMLAADAIAEDPDQPRHEFDTKALTELAETIRERGVRQPISVRPDQQQAGRWVLNFGARRLRASRLAGLKEIPAFVDTTADNYDQLIENEQREGLTPLELALFVQKRLALGDKQAQIAKRLGKSRQWVSLTTALIEAPDWLLQAYREGRCRGMNELYELRRLHEAHAQAVEAWVAEQGAITRERIAGLRDGLETRATLTPHALAESPPQQEEEGAALDRCSTAPNASPRDRAASPAPSQPTARSPNVDPHIRVEFDGQVYELVVSVAPKQPGHLFVQPLNGGPRMLVPAASLKLLGFGGA